MLRMNQIKTSLGAKALQAKGIASSNVLMFYQVLIDREPDELWTEVRDTVQ